MFLRRHHCRSCCGSFCFQVSARQRRFKETERSRGNRKGCRICRNCFRDSCMRNIEGEFSGGDSSSLAENSVESLTFRIPSQGTNTNGIKKRRSRLLLVGSYVDGVASSYATIFTSQISRVRHSVSNSKHLELVTRSGMKIDIVFDIVQEAWAWRSTLYSRPYEFQIRSFCVGRFDFVRSVCKSNRLGRSILLLSPLVSGILFSGRRQGSREFERNGLGR